jgi:hypothetical protein
MIWRVLVCTIMGLLAPFVCLFYRKGWFATPDDTVSPHGSYEPTMQRIYAWSVWLGDYVWHGLRNRAYGLAYALKPQEFKDCTKYTQLLGTNRTYGPLRIINIEGYKEYTLSLGICHVIFGYRLRPVDDRIGVDVHVEHPNMDARPIFSIRSGGTDL